MGQGAAAQMDKPLVAPPSDWTVPPVTIAVATQMRTGSYYLAELMQATGKLGNPLEYFFIGALRGEFPGRGETHLDRCRLAIEHGRSANGVVAIKFFLEALATFQRSGRMADWFGTPRWVLLQRRDLLGQAISMRIALQTRAYRAEQAVLREPIYDGAAILRTLKDIARRNAAWETYFARTGVEPLRVFYEDLERDPRAAIESIGRFVGIEIEPTDFRPATRLTRQRTALNEEWRERFISEFGNPDHLDWKPRGRGRSQRAPVALWRRVLRRLMR